MLSSFIDRVPDDIPLRESEHVLLCWLLLIDGGPQRGKIGGLLMSEAADLCPGHD
jgi:hypothetical protein